MSDPIALGVLLTALLGVLLAIVAIAWRWIDSHRRTVYRLADAIRQRIAALGLVAGLRRRHPRTWDFIRARLSPSGYLGLHLTIGLLLSLGALVFFVTVVEDIGDREEMALLDGLVLDWLRQHATPAGTQIVSAVSYVGAPVIVAALAVVVTIILVVKRDRTLLLGWWAALVGGSLLNMLLKASFQRPRPEEAGQFLRGHSWSFPSGHAMGSVVAYGMLAYVVALYVTSWKRRLVIAVGAVLLILAIGLTRLYLGVHYFTDVIAGFAGGIVWLSACISGVEVSRRKRSVLRRDVADVEPSASASVDRSPEPARGAVTATHHWLRWGGVLLALSGVGLIAAFVLMARRVDIADELLITVVVVYIAALVAWISALRRDEGRK